MRNALTPAQRDAPRVPLPASPPLVRRALIAGVERKFGIAIDPVHFVVRAHGALDRLDDMRPLFIGKPPSLATMRAFFDDVARGHLRRSLR